MNRVGTWFALCPAGRVVEIGELASRLGFLPQERPRVVHGQLHVEIDDELTGGTGELIVSLSRAPHVLQEAAEFAELYGATRPDREQIATCAARYELTWDVAHSQEVYETLLLVTGKLAKLCGAVIFNSDQRTFV